MLALYDGDLMAQSHYDGAAWSVTIDRADPRIRISPEVLADRSFAAPLNIEQTGRIVRFHADNRTVVYRLDHYDPRLGLYLASWPD